MRPGYALSMTLSALLALSRFPAGSAQAQTIINGGQIVTVPSAAQPSPWTLPGTLYIGNTSTGTLNIMSGGAVSNTAASVGRNSGSSGTVTVSGPNASWTNSGEFHVGYSGTGALTIENGGAVSSVLSTATSYVGYNLSAPGRVTVSGTNSTWSNSGNLNVGFRGGTARSPSRAVASSATRPAMSGTKPAARER
jgi:fibronectin-binding autotransporter adhesin